MTRTHKTVHTFPAPKTHPKPAIPLLDRDEGADYLEYLLDLADRLLNPRHDDELQPA